MASEACDRRGKWFRPCKWEAQYDYEGPSDAMRDDVSYWEGPLIRSMADKLVERRTYRGSLCLTCGRAAYPPHFTEPSP